jgi:pimeloyl-ACP methyl ester carboxylesterase
VAHDIGGAVSLRARLFHEAEYRSLMLVDVVAIAPTGSPFYKFVREHADAMADIPDYIHAAILRAYIQGASHVGLRDRDLAMLVEPWTTHDGKPAFYRQIAQADERPLEEIRDRLADLDLPVRILWGTDDTWIPVDVADQLAELIPGATVRRIADAGHLVQLDAPVTVANEVRAWLAR